MAVHVHCPTSGNGGRAQPDTKRLVLSPASALDGGEDEGAGAQEGGEECDGCECAGLESGHG